MRMRAPIIATALLLAGCSTTESHDELMKELVQGEPEIGPQPDKASGTALVESAVKAQLKDPYSAQFSWPNDFRRDWYKPMLRSKIYGWVTCGTVNAKNGYGGYVGTEAVIGIIANGQVVYTEVDDGRYATVAPECAKAGLPVS